MRYSARRAKAFTLLEMLVVLAVGAIVVSICVTMTAQAQRFWADHQARIAAGRSAWQCLNRIARDVRMASADAPVAGSDGRGALADALSEKALTRVEAGAIEGVTANDDTLALFTARATDYQGIRVPGQVRFALKRDGSGRVLGVVRQSAPPGVALADGYETIMSERVMSLDFQYLDAAGAWRPAWEDAATMPRAVRITVASVPERMSRRGDIQEFTTVVTLAGSARIPG